MRWRMVSCSSGSSWLMASPNFRFGLPSRELSSVDGDQGTLLVCKCDRREVERQVNNWAGSWLCVAGFRRVRGEVRRRRCGSV